MSTGDFGQEFVIQLVDRPVVGDETVMVVSGEGTAALGALVGWLAGQKLFQLGPEMDQGKVGGHVFHRLVAHDALAATATAGRRLPGCCGRAPVPSLGRVILLTAPG